MACRSSMDGVITPEDPASPLPPPAQAAVFGTTHWSVVLTAGRTDSTCAQAALATLCQTYWPPLYAYVRRRGYSPHDAEDLTQEFFARFLQRNDVTMVGPERGKFRSYLLAAMNHFLSDEWDKTRAAKRGGGQVSHLDTSVAESAYAADYADTLTPEKLFHQRWAITVLETVQERLRREHEREGKTALFETLRFSLMGERSAVPYAGLAARLGLSEGAIKVAVHRLRQRYRLVLRETIAATVSSPEEVEEELRQLLQAVAGL
jgi:RNA polymerase sigma factor (sigma-70 family)